MLFRLFFGRLVCQQGHAYSRTGRRISFNFQLLNVQLNNREYPVSGSVLFRPEHISGVTDSVPQQRRLDHTITKVLHSVFEVFVSVVWVRFTVRIRHSTNTNTNTTVISIAPPTV